MVFDDSPSIESPRVVRYAARLGLLLMLVGILFVVASSSVSAADDEAPRVAGPQDVPGADVVLLEGQSYLLDARGSTDNVGIVRYRWEITDPMGVTFNLTSTTPTRSWTPADLGLYRVVSWAEDAASNEGAKAYVVDVAEPISPGTIYGGKVTYDHSVSISGGQLNYTSLELDFTGGLTRDPPSYPTGEMLSEGITFAGLSDGSLAGSWGPYSTAYGSVFEETGTVLVGKVALANSGGTNYGFTYTFDKPEDLTSYRFLSAWFLQYFLTGRYYYAEFYDESGNYIRVTPPTPTSNVIGVWTGISVSMDISNVGNILYSGMSDLTAVKEFKLRYYGQRETILMDGVTFSRKAPADNMTESATPSGDFSGTWMGWSTRSNVAYVGSSSVYRRITANTQTFTMEYVWDNAADLTRYNAIRMLSWYATGVANGGYVRITGIEWDDIYGASARYSATQWPYIHLYETDRYSTWALTFVPFDKAGYTETGSMDWTKVGRMALTVIAQRIGDLYIDGFEFYQSRIFTPGAPGITENLAHGIYVQPSGSLSLYNVDFSPTGPYGGFVMAWGDLAVRDSTLQDLWGTVHPSIPLDGYTWGGFIASGAKVSLDSVTVDGAASSAFSLVNSNITATYVTVTDAGQDMPGAGIGIVYSGTAAGSTYRATLASVDITQTATGSGLQVLFADALGKVDLDLQAVNASSNGVNGLQLTMTGAVGNVSVSIMDSSVDINGGSGLVLYCGKTVTQMSSIDLSVDGLEAIDNAAAGISMAMESSIADVRVSLGDLQVEGNDANGVELRVLDSSGMVTLDTADATITGNHGNGLAVLVALKPFNLLDEPQMPDIDISVDLSSCDVTDNDGDGVYEEFSTGVTITFPPYPRHVYSLTATDVDFVDNRGDGFSVTEVALGTDRTADYSFVDARFDGNDGCGFLLVENVYLRATAENTFTFRNATFRDNERGVEQDITSAFLSIFSFEDCIFSGNDNEAVRAYTLAATYRYACVEYYIESSTVDDPMYFNLDGAFMEPAISNRTTLAVTVSIRNCTIASEFPLHIMGAGQYKSTLAAKYIYPLEAKMFYTGNTLTAPSRSDGLSVEFWGATAVEAEIVIEDVTFDSPSKDGINVILGSRSTLPDHQRIIYGSVQITNVSIRNPGRYGITLTAATIEDMIALRGVLCRITDVTVTGAVVSARLDGVDTEILDCMLGDMALTSVFAGDCTVDLRNTVFGAIYEPNLKAEGSGRIRLWFGLDVTVLWKDSIEPVVGARVELIDNTYRTFGFGEVAGTEAVTFRDLNAITIVEAGTYSGNPYRVSTSYLDLFQNRFVDVTSDTTVTIWLVDDLPPILNLQSPRDGSTQSSDVIRVVGTAYDIHRTIDRAMVSIDGETWVSATGTESFTCSLPGISDGITILRVRAFDTSGNWAEVMVSVRVDTTPPDLIVVIPREGQVTNDPRMRVLAATETGASAFVNQVPVELTYTLVDHWVDLVEGRNIIEVSVMDALGNVRQVFINVSLDTIMPSLLVASHAAWSSVSTSTIKVVGRTDPDGVTLRVAGIVAAVDASGRFEVSVALGPGRNDLTLLAEDVAGNKQVLTLTIFLDQEPPSLIILEPRDGGIYKEGLVDVVGLVEPGSTVYVANRMVTVVNGGFSVQLSLRDGTHLIDIRAVDSAGNEHTQGVMLTVDGAAPLLEVHEPVNGLVTQGDSVPVKGALAGGHQGVVLTVNGVTMTMGSDGTFDTTVALREGTNTIVVMATDAAGNVARSELQVFRDSVPPFLEVSLPDAVLDEATGSYRTSSGKVLVSGFGELGSTVRVNGVAVSLDGVTGQFSITLDLPGGGGKGSTLVIKVVAMDAAGNSVTTTRTVTGEAVEEETSLSDAAGWALLVVAILVLVVGVVFLLRSKAAGTSRTEEGTEELDPGEGDEDEEEEVDR